ncbi:MAG: autotransporter assembly complex protein TamA [Alphaproteobacteria bacterium]|nr:autotransporter assembly complex protein TamA [Alphaproteobacteria bacterium]
MKNRLGCLWLASALCVLWLGPAPAARAADGLSYTVKVSGIKDSGLRKSVIEASGLTEKPQRQVLSLRALRRRVENSMERVSALLRARGYYAAQQEFAVTEKGKDGAGVTLRIDLGPPYKIGSYTLVLTEPRPDNRKIAIPFKDLGFKPGDVARSDVVVGSDAKLLAWLARRSYPLARIEKRRNVVDHRARTLSVEVTLETGPFTRFGATLIEGLRDVEPVVVRRRRQWTRGAPYDASKLEATRKKLRETGLFSSVIVRHGEKTDAAGQLPIIVKVTERKHRSIGAGASYSSTEGALGKLFWEHRNLFGGGEQLRARIEAGQIRQGLFGDFRIPDFGAPEQDLVFDARLARESPDAFTSREIAAVARLERRVFDIYRVSAGVGLDRSIVEDGEGDENFSFLTLPLALRRDSTKDLLDPHRGGRDTLTVTPNFGILGTDANFVAAQAFDTVYVPVIPDEVLTLAGWVRIGTIVGAETADIPANKRLYSGGSGSVRGYALNSIGPLDANNDPVGGRSRTAFGVELRWRVAGPFGLVAFVEAGGVYDDPVPDWGEDLFWGAGLGLRYYVPRIGPIRLDVAVPLNRRNSVDDAFQILVSLGQAF